VPEKGKRRTAARTAQPEAVFADGLIGRFVDNVFDNPALSGGLFVMALTASAIVSNALFLQSVRHPEPLFATRPPLVVERHVPVPIPPHRDDSTGSVTPPLPRPSPLAAAPIAASAPPAELHKDTTVRDIQTVLARRGLYLGAIDGLYGELSRSAIVAYEKAAGLPEKGEATPQILEHMRSSPALTPLPPPVVAAPPAAAVRAPVASAPVAAPEVPPAPAAPSAEEVRAEIERLRYERIQTALNRAGYGPVVVNGSADEATTSAIRRFELDNGLPISGKVGDDLIERLVAIGAMPAA
jgi:peptidoglycan hydrolase-like protein with peptidoglycan-binding domain